MVLSPRRRGCRDAQLPQLPFPRLVGPQPGGPGLVTAGEITAGEMTSLEKFRRGALSPPQLPDILTQLEGMTGVPSRMSGDQSLVCLVGQVREVPSGSA